MSDDHAMDWHSGGTFDDEGNRLDGFPQTDRPRTKKHPLWDLMCAPQRTYNRLWDIERMESYGEASKWMRGEFNFLEWNYGDWQVAYLWMREDLNEITTTFYPDLNRDLEHWRNSCSKLSRRKESEHERREREVHINIPF